MRMNPSATLTDISYWIPTTNSFLEVREDGKKCTSILRSKASHMPKMLKYEIFDSEGKSQGSYSDSESETDSKYSFSPSLVEFEASESPKLKSHDCLLYKKNYCEDNKTNKEKTADNSEGVEFGNTCFSMLDFEMED